MLWADQVSSQRVCALNLRIYVYHGTHVYSSIDPVSGKEPDNETGYPKVRAIWFDSELCTTVYQIDGLYIRYSFVRLDLSSPRVCALKLEGSKTTLNSNLLTATRTLKIPLTRSIPIFDISSIVRDQM